MKNKNLRIEIRLSEQEKERIDLGADNLNISRTDFILLCTENYFQFNNQRNEKLPALFCSIANIFNETKMVSSTQYEDTTRKVMDMLWSYLNK